MRRLLGIALLLCLGLSACADRSAGVAVGASNRGAGVAVFANVADVALFVGSAFSGVMVHVGSDGRDSGRYSSGRIVRAPAAPPLPSAAPRPPALERPSCPGPLEGYESARRQGLLEHDE